MKALANPRAEEEFDDWIIRAGGNPIGSEVAAEWGFRGLGAGRLVVLDLPDPIAGNGVIFAAANACMALQGPLEGRRGPLLAETLQDAIGDGWSPAEATRAAISVGEVRSATNVRGRDDVRDFLAQGYPSFAGRAWIGYDDRPATRQAYGQSLVLSVAPDGGLRWAFSSTIERGIAVSATLGWPRRGAA